MAWCRVGRRGKGMATRRSAGQRNGKVKSRRVQKRKGDAGVSDGKQGTCSASHCPAMEQQRNALVSNGNAKRCLALKWRWNCTDSHGTAMEVYRPDNHSDGEDKNGLETHRKCIAQSSRAAD